jgi:hypothetical protein
MCIILCYYHIIFCTITNFDRTYTRQELHYIETKLNIIFLTFDTKFHYWFTCNFMTLIVMAMLVWWGINEIWIQTMVKWYWQGATEVPGGNHNMNNKVMQKPTLVMKHFISKKRCFVISRYAKHIINKIIKFRAPKLAFRTRVHGFSKNLGATSKFQVLEGWPEATSILRTHKYEHHYMKSSHHGDLAQRICWQCLRKC